MPNHYERFLVNASWLIKLRWVAVIGQLMTIAGVWFLLEIEIPLAWALLVIIAATAISNVLLQLAFANILPQIDKRVLPWETILGIVMVMDMLSLTALLFASGGPNNPFLLFFFVNLSLSALVVDRHWVWWLNGLSICCFGLLLIDHHPIHPLNLGDQMLPIRETGRPTLEQCGLFVSFIACSSVIVYFLTRLTDELRQQQADLRLAQQRQLQSEKMEALGTLAAGAAHELATPLSTIAVVAREVEKSFEHHPLEFPGAQDVIDDVHLIRQELDRCRKILDRMASHAGETVGEAFQFCSLKQIVDEVLAPLPEKNRIQVVYTGEIANTKVKVPLDSVGQALRGLVQNALDASPYEMPVRLHVELVNGDWQWTIRDSGSGMPDDVLQRISEPFFTTKPAGKGMGLGLFLAKNVIRRLGGQLEIESAPGRGTTVKLTVPKQATATGGNAVTRDGD